MTDLAVLLACHSPVWAGVIERLDLDEMVAAGQTSRAMRALFHDPATLARRFCFYRAVRLKTPAIMRWWPAALRDAHATDREEGGVGRMESVDDRSPAACCDENGDGQRDNDRDRCLALNERGLATGAGAWLEIAPSGRVHSWRARCRRLAAARRCASRPDASSDVLGDALLAAAACGDGVFFVDLLDRMLAQGKYALDRDGYDAMHHHVSDHMTAAGETLAQGVWAEDDSDLERVVPAAVHALACLLSALRHGLFQSPPRSSHRVWVRRRERRARPYTRPDPAVETEAVRRILDALPCQWVCGRPAVARTAAALFALLLSTGRGVAPTQRPYAVRRYDPRTRNADRRDGDHCNDDDDDDDDDRQAVLDLASQCLRVAQSDRERWHALASRVAAHALDARFGPELGRRLTALAMPTADSTHDPRQGRFRETCARLAHQAIGIQSAPLRNVPHDPTIDRVLAILASLPI